MLNAEIFQKKVQKNRTKSKGSGERSCLPLGTPHWWAPAAEGWAKKPHSAPSWHLESAERRGSSPCSERCCAPAAPTPALTTHYQTGCISQGRQGKCIERSLVRGRAAGSGCLSQPPRPQSALGCPALTWWFCAPDTLLHPGSPWGCSCWMLAGQECKNSPETGAEPHMGLCPTYELGSSEGHPQWGLHSDREHQKRSLLNALVMPGAHFRGSATFLCGLPGSACGQRQQ